MLNIDHFPGSNRTRSIQRSLSLRFTRMSGPLQLSDNVGNLDTQYRFCVAPGFNHVLALPVESPTSLDYQFAICNMRILQKFA